MGKCLFFYSINNTIEFLMKLLKLNNLITAYIVGEMLLQLFYITGNVILPHLSPLWKSSTANVKMKSNLNLPFVF